VAVVAGDIIEAILGESMQRPSREVLFESLVEEHAVVVGGSNAGSKIAETDKEHNNKRDN